jgi:hypothetical protein
MRDHVPASAGTTVVLETGAVVVVIGAVVVDAGVVVVDVADFLPPPPQPATTTRAAMATNHPRRWRFTLFLLADGSSQCNTRDALPTGSFDSVELRCPPFRPH